MKVCFAVLFLSVTVSAQVFPSRGRISQGGAAVSTTVGQATSGALSLFVDPTGSDTGACTGAGASACSTIQGAYDKVPKLVTDPVTITVASGSYVGAYGTGFTIGKARTSAAGAYVLLLGTFVTSTIATGSPTGTATGGTAGTGTPAVFGTLTDGAATWTVNDLRLRELEITGGTGSGQVRPICSNTATVITICGTFTTAPVGGSSTYAVLDSASIITTSVNRPVSILGAEGTGASSAGLWFYGNVADATNLSGPTGSTFGVRRMKIATAAGAGIVVVGPTSLLVDQDQIAPTSGHGINVTRAPLVVQDTTILEPGGFISIVVGNSSPSVSVTRALFRTGVFGLDFSNVQNIILTGVKVDSPTSTGIFLRSVIGSGQMVGSQIDCGGVGTGISAVSATGGARLGIDWGGSGGDISNCVTGINAVGTHHFSLAGVWSGTGNTTAISLNKGAALQYSSTSTLTGTTEVSIDGTAYTVANMRLLTPILINNLNHSTRIYE